MAEPMVYRRLRAPNEDGGVLLDPAGREIASLVARNLALHEQSDGLLGDASLHKLRRAARIGLAQAARDFTGRYTDVSWVDERLASERIYATGHQPELFHPGVWLKNFVLDALAKRDGALAVHVLIDNDEAHAPAIRVPAGSLDEPRIENIAYDEQPNPRAWEESVLQDAAAFRTFGGRVRSAVAPLIAAPLIDDLWRSANATFDSTHNTGQALAQLRHRLELAWGVRTLEVPLSTLVDAPAFQYFTAYLLRELPRFHTAHNAALAEYRTVHKLRSTSQPLPDLGQRDDALEAPFWVWSRQDSTRRRLWVTHRGSSIHLSDGGAYSWETTGTNVESIAALLRGMNEEGFNGGFKVRPRALVTTMMLRLLASDVFIHGIGGAKYDQVTDRIIADFFGIEPPGFLTATGTKRLPLPHTSAAPGDVEQIDKQLRGLRFKPEEHVDVSTQTDSERARIEQLIAEKRRWLRMEIAPGQLAERHAALAEINAALTNYVSTRRDELAAERLRVEAELRRQAILGSREFSFCLYPEATLRPWLLDAAAQAL